MVTLARCLYVASCSSALSVLPTILFPCVNLHMGGGDADAAGLKLHSIFKLFSFVIQEVRSVMVWAVARPVRQHEDIMLSTNKKHHSVHQACPLCSCVFPFTELQWLFGILNTFVIIENFKRVTSVYDQDSSYPTNRVCQWCSCFQLPQSCWEKIQVWGIISLMQYVFMGSQKGSNPIVKC